MESGHRENRTTDVTGKVFKEEMAVSTPVGYSGQMGLKREQRGIYAEDRSCETSKDPFLHSDQ